MSLKPGSLVQLHVPDNERLHGSNATIKQLTSWGAYVSCEAAATGQFRASWGEMVEVTALNGKGQPLLGGGQRVNGGKPKTEEEATGDVCGFCGGVNLFRAGSCLTCADCGSTTGCG